MLDDIMDFMLMLLMVLVIVFVAFITIGGGVEVYNSYKAEPAQFACSQKQMDSRRRSFTDSVVCVPYPIRQDTTTVRVTQ